MIPVEHRAEQDRSADQVVRIVFDASDRIGPREVDVSLQAAHEIAALGALELLRPLPLELRAELEHGLFGPSGEHEDGGAEVVGDLLLLKLAEHLVNRIFSRLWV